MEIDGNKLKAVLSVIENFNKHNFLLDKYNISIYENEEIYMIVFSPTLKFPSDYYGNPGDEKGIEYIVSKDDFRILRIVYNR